MWLVLKAFYKQTKKKKSRELYIDWLWEAKLAAGNDDKFISSLCLKSSLSGNKTRSNPRVQEIFSISSNIRSFFRVGFFYFLSSQGSFLKYEKVFRVSVSWNIRKFHFLKHKEFFFGVSVSWNIRKGFSWEDIRNFFRVSISWNIRNFLMLELESSIFSTI